MNDGFGVVVFVVFALGIATGVLVTHAIWDANTEQLEKDAIDRDYARHNPTTGIWEWIEPEGKEIKETK